MKLKNKTRFLNELARVSENPKDFIYACMALQNLTAFTLAERMDMTHQNFYVKMSQIGNGTCSLLPRTIVDISKGLDIPPEILNRVIADYTLNKYLNGINQNT